MSNCNGVFSADGMSIENNLVKVEWYNADEGWSGDYDPDDPNDENLLRFDVYRRGPDGEWEEVEDASYCTQMPASTCKEVLQRALRMLLKEYTNALSSNPNCSVKKLGESLSWICPGMFEPPISRAMVRNGIKNGLIRFVLDPNLKKGTVCQIGDYWFYHGGLTAEEESPDEYIRNTPLEVQVKEVYDTLDAFYKDEGSTDEYKYYEVFLSENLSQVGDESLKNELILNDLPVSGALKVLDVVSKKILHDIAPDDPGDIPPDLAMRKVVALYAADDQIVVEVLP